MSEPLSCRVGTPWQNLVISEVPQPILCKILIPSTNIRLLLDVAVDQTVATKTD